jgi:hypothetical protein
MCVAVSAEVQKVLNKEVVETTREPGWCFSFQRGVIWFWQIASLTGTSNSQPFSSNPSDHTESSSSVFVGLVYFLLTLTYRMQPFRFSSESLQYLAALLVGRSYFHFGPPPALWLYEKLCFSLSTTVFGPLFS